MLIQGEMYMYKNKADEKKPKCLKLNHDFSSDIIKIAEKIKQAGGRLYLVGGAVRDKIINNSDIQDEDFCVVGISKEEFCMLFPDAKKRGKSFEVFDLNNREFALARKEQKIGKKHNDFKTITNKNISIEEDLKRRDITINAIAQDVLTGDIIDPYNGTKDIENKIIRAVSKSFKEDPLRVYRVARFASKLGFRIDNRTIKYMKCLKSELIYLSPERVFDELKKALKTSKPSTFFEVLRKSEVLDVHFIEIFRLIGALQPKKYHPEGDAYAHTMLALDMASSLTQNEIIRFCALVHDLGKGVTPKEMYPHHTGHEITGIKQVENFCKRLKMPSVWTKCAKVAVKEHMRAGLFEKMKVAKKVSFIENIGKSLIGLDGLAIVVESDRNCRGVRSNKPQFAKIGNKMLKEINGNYIKEKYNIKEGIKLKEKMHQERIIWMQNFENQTKSI